MLMISFLINSFITLVNLLYTLQETIFGIVLVVLFYVYLVA